MPRIVWADQALKDLDRIDEWLSGQRSPQFALETLVAIQQRAISLLDFPAIGSPISGNTRKLRIGRMPYLMLYQLDDGRIEVLRIVHERQNWIDLA